MVTNHQVLVKWIETTITEDAQTVLEDLGYMDKHHLVSHIIRTSPKTKQPLQESGV